VARDDLAAMRSSWPAFTEQLRGLGLHSAQALPMRLRDDTIGALNLFRVEPGRLSEADLRIGQAMADVATVGLVQERALAAHIIDGLLDDEMLSEGRRTTTDTPPRA
jgi:hypothetical protein